MVERPAKDTTVVHLLRGASPEAVVPTAVRLLRPHEQQYCRREFGLPPHGDLLKHVPPDMVVDEQYIPPHLLC